MIEAPEYLTGSQRRLWDRHAVDFNLAESEAIELLETAVVHLDQAKNAAKIVAKEGLSITINAGKTQVAHPLLKTERDSRILALKTLKDLRSKYPAKTEQREAKKSPRSQAKENDAS